MPERDVHALRAEALAALAAATQAANGAPDVESALGSLTAATQKALGEKKRIFVQAGSGRVSASLWSQASFSSHRTSA